MNIEAGVMTIPYLEALDAYRNYATAVKAQRASREDLMLYRGLRALIRGKKVIDLNAVIGAAGRDTHGRPKLAVARADWPHVTCDGFSGSFRFVREVFGRRSRGTVEVPVRCFPVAVAGTPPSHTVRCRAQVPLIPPQLRPASAVTDHHLLFEAEWERQPPVDPMLLKRIDGPFFVVLAVWALTPLEQAVLRMHL